MLNSLPGLGIYRLLEVLQVGQAHMECSVDLYYTKEADLKQGDILWTKQTRQHFSICHIKAELN